MEVLTEIAQRKREELWCTRELNESEQMKIIGMALEKLEDDLKEQLLQVKEVNKILFELEEAYLDYSAVFGEENFVRGFIEGVKFATQLKKELIDIKKEQPAVTDCPNAQIK